MKKIILLLVIATTFVCCKKSPQPSAGNRGSTPPSTATTLNDSTCAVTALQGIWTLDSTINYNAGVAGAVTYTVANVSNQTFTLSTAYYYSGTHPANYSLQMTYQEGNIPQQASYWEVNKGTQYNSTGLLRFTTGVGPGIYIRTLNSHNFVLSLNSGVLQGQVFYYHK